MTSWREDLFAWTLDADAVLLLKQENMRAFCGYTGEGVVLARVGEVVIVTDARYTVQASEQSPDAFVDTLASGVSHARRIAYWLGAWGAENVAFEDETWNVADFSQLQKECAGTGFLALGDNLTRWRMPKTHDQIERIAHAARIADEAFSDALGYLCCGMTEKEAAWRLERSMRERGAEALSFETIVAGGENGAKPHAIPTDRPFAQGDLIVMDFGCKCDGYCSDMTRTVAMGGISDVCRHIYDVTHAAQRAAKQALCAGKTGVFVDSVARDIITKAGYGDCFGHGLGHGVGLEIHELPRLTPTQAGQIVLEEGHVVSVEPGIYLPGVAGVRIEDLCVVTKTGADSLSHSPTELIVL